MYCASMWVEPRPSGWELGVGSGGLGFLIHEVVAGGIVEAGRVHGRSGLNPNTRTYWIRT